MSKDISLLLKGVAILFMMLLHLFMGQEVVVDGEVVSYTGFPFTWINRCVNPVDFYLILGGYGLFKTRHTYQFQQKMFKKTLSLYLHYWLSLLLFIPIGALVVGLDKYPGSLECFLLNVSGLKLTYNHAVWFLLPYVLLMITSSCIFKVFDEHPKMYIASMFLCYLISILMIRSNIGVFFVEGHPLYFLKVYLNFIFPFAIGAVLAKYAIIEKINLSGSVSLVLLFALLVLRSYITVSIVNPFYTALFIILFNKVTIVNFIRSFLLKLGQRSTSIWFIHCYFCYYLFTDYIYMIKQPVIMFVALVSICYVCSIFLDRMNRKTKQYLQLINIKV